jgi:hypothetical protein
MTLNASRNRSLRLRQLSSVIVDFHLFSFRLVARPVAIFGTRPFGRPAVFDAFLATERVVGSRRQTIVDPVPTRSLNERRECDRDVIVPLRESVGSDHLLIVGGCNPGRICRRNVEHDVEWWRHLTVSPL